MSIDIKNKILLGPMAGITDLPFRLLCKRQGADIVCTEMISAKAILYNNKNTYSLMRTSPEEGPVILQLFGSEPDVCAEIAERLSEGPWAAIDFNMGCPMPKIVGNGEGSALMKDVKLAGRIIEAMVKKSKLPITVKMRKGFDDGHVNAVELAKAVEASGASAVTVHGRTREQYYHGNADWDIIGKVKNAVSIPVIGSGDVDSLSAAEKMKADTGCDSVMIARAALGRPWVFNKVAKEYGREEIKSAILEHLRMQADFNGKELAVREMRKHIAWYTHGLRGSAVLRDEVNKISEYSELIDKIYTI